VKRIFEVLVLGIVASLIAGLILAPHLIPVFWKTYRTELYIAFLLIVALALLYFIWERTVTSKEGLAEAFDVSKPVKKLTPADFHITNYRKFYIQRESDKEIEALLKERKYVFITGIPMLGKTRMAYEAAKKLRGFYLLKPKYERIDIQKLKLPFLKKKVVLFLDDLNKYVRKFHLDDLIRKLKRQSKDLVVIATCRSGKEFDQISAEKEMETLLTQCHKGKTEPRKLEPEEQRKLATAVDKRLERIASDGTPGSITIDLRYMKKRYEELGDEKSILKCLKLLREGYIFLWKENLVKEVSNRIFDLNTERRRWDGYIKSLVTNGFIDKSSERILIAHDVYLDDTFVDDYSAMDGDLVHLRDVLFQSNDLPNLFNLGFAFYLRGNLEEGVDCYQKSIRINPDLAETHNNLGNLLKRLRRYEDAEKQYRQALRINPNDGMVHNNLGTLLHKLSKYDEAEKEYREALRIIPDHAQTHSNLGNLLFELKRPTEAEKECREALRINPHLAEAHNNLGNSLYDLKRYSEAEKEYRAALQINPAYAEAHNNLANLLIELRRPGEAQAEYVFALEINPDFAEAHFNLGFLLIGFNRKHEAKTQFEIARDLFRKQGREEYAKKAEGFLKDL